MNEAEEHIRRAQEALEAERVEQLRAKAAAKRQILVLSAALGGIIVLFIVAWMFSGYFSLEDEEEAAREHNTREWLEYEKKKEQEAVAWQQERQESRRREREAMLHKQDVPNPNVTPENYTRLMTGIHDKEALIKVFGQPHSIEGPSDGDETWTYLGEKNEFIISFNWRENSLEVQVFKSRPPSGPLIERIESKGPSGTTITQWRTYSWPDAATR